MNLSHSEALAYLNKLIGQSVFVRVRGGFEDDRSIGALRVDSEAVLESCDAESLELTWPNGRVSFYLEHATFRLPGPEETALIGLEIVLPQVKCVISF